MGGSGHSGASRPRALCPLGSQRGAAPVWPQTSQRHPRRQSCSRFLWGRDFTPQNFFDFFVYVISVNKQGTRRKKIHYITFLLKYCGSLPILNSNMG